MSLYGGIDQSYTGFAWVIVDSTIPGWHMDFLQRFPPKANQSDRLADVQAWISSTLYELREEREITLDGLAMEGYAPGSKFGREMAGELGAAVKLALRSHGRVYDVKYPAIIPPTKVKKFATGKGNARKNEMLLAVFKRWNVEYSDDNLADAYVLAQMAAALGDPGLDLTKFQIEAIDGL